MNWKIVGPAVFLTAAFHSSFAQGTTKAAWAGHWRLDKTASHFVGVAVTIQHLPHSYCFDLGGTTIKVGDDGKDYPTAPTRTTSFKQIEAGRWLRVHKMNGKTLDTSVFTMAHDGRSFLIHTVAVDDAGVKHVSDEIFRREGAGTGINGTWRSTKGGLNTSEIIDITSVGDHGLRVEYPGQEMSFVTFMDGSAVPYSGAHAVPSVLITVSRISPTVLHWTELLNGHPYMEGTYSLSFDGHQLTEASWYVTRPQERDEAVYKRE